MKAKRRAVAATDDETILTLFEARNEQAIAVSEQQYGALCRSVARGITGSDEDAAECLSDALLTAWNAIPPAKPQNLRAYLLRLVRNAALDRWRAAHTEKRQAAQIRSSLEELAEIIPDSSDIVTETERREMLRAVTDFLRTLPQAQRDLFVRRYWYETDIASLARLFGMSQAHVRMTLSRLRKRLHQYLEKEGLL